MVKRSRSTMEAPKRVKPPEPWWARPRAAAALVAALVVLAYARSLGNGFSYDEGLVIVQAQRFLRSGEIGTLFSKQYFAASLEGTWRPVCTLTYMLDAALALHPAVFKAQSLLWHIGTSLLVMALARQLFPGRHGRFALVAGLVFALHPVTTETVDNASFREDSLAAFFTLATLLLALRGRGGWALGAYVLALLSKESAVVAPVLLAGIRLGGRPNARRPLPAIAHELGPFVAITVAYLMIRFGPLATPVAYASYPGGSLGATLVGMPAVWAHYLRLLIWPWPLCADYSGYFRFGAQPVMPVVRALVVVAAFAGAFVLAAKRARLHKSPLLALGLGWFAVALGPVSNFIPVPVPAAERFLYLPLVGVALAAAAAADLLARRLSPLAQRGAVLAGAGVLAAFVVLINLRHRAWQDDETLWNETVAQNPRACGAQSAVGGNLLTRGMEHEDPDPELLRRAVAQQELALHLCADSGDVNRTAIIYTRLGASHAMLNEPRPAQAALERAIELAPRYGLPVVWLGYVRFIEGDKDGASALLERAVIKLGPPDAAVAKVAERYMYRL